MRRVAGVPTLNTHREGTGPALLLLPGFASPLEEFEAVVPELARRFDVLAVDLPGQGQSSALPASLRPDVAALADAVEEELDRQGVTVAHVLGVSLGGRIGLELARRQRARSVVAIAPTGPLTPPERAYQAAVLVSARLGFSALAPVADRLMGGAAPRTAALALLRARGWRTPPGEAAALVREFAEAQDFWRLLRHAVLPEATIDYGRSAVRSASPRAPTTSSRSARPRGWRSWYPGPGSACSPSPVTAASPTSRSVWSPSWRRPRRLPVIGEPGGHRGVRPGRAGHRINGLRTNPATASASAASGIRFTSGCRRRKV
nr:alpha/beta fold hydrolase [Geodermatophilus chilensis]